MSTGNKKDYLLPVSVLRSANKRECHFLMRMRYFLWFPILILFWSDKALLLGEKERGWAGLEAVRRSLIRTMRTHSQVHRLTRI